MVGSKQTDQNPIHLTDTRADYFHGSRQLNILIFELFDRIQSKDKRKIGNHLFSKYLTNGIGAAKMLLAPNMHSVEMISLWIKIRFGAGSC
jgi:hypothetical protein